MAASPDGRKREERDGQSQEEGGDIHQREQRKRRETGVKSTAALRRASPQRRGRGFGVGRGRG